MRFMHLADLHIGKKVNGFSMIEDQRFVFEQVLGVAEKERVNGIILAGDIYDKKMPSSEAVQLFDWFLTELNRMHLPVYMISGNHDSGERLTFGAKILEKSDVYVAPLYNGDLCKLLLKDEYGLLNLYMLPFVQPVQVRQVLARKEAGVGEECDMSDVETVDSLEEIASIKTYQDAVSKILAQAEINPSERNLLIAHQFVTGGEWCDSEEKSVGGIEDVSAEVFSNFDYVALGHLHGPQVVGSEKLRYAGSLLKYSFSECEHRKSITLVELKNKGEVSVKTIDVKPLHDMRIIQGYYNDLMKKDFYTGIKRDDYIKVELLDEKPIPEVMNKLRTVYENVMGVKYVANTPENRADFNQTNVGTVKSPIEYVEELFAMQNGNDKKLNEEQMKVVSDFINEIWGVAE